MAASRDHTGPWGRISMAQTRLWLQCIVCDEWYEVYMFEGQLMCPDCEEDWRRMSQWCLAQAIARESINPSLRKRTVIAHARSAILMLMRAAESSTGRDAPTMCACHVMWSTMKVACAAVVFLTTCDVFSEFATLFLFRLQSLIHDLLKVGQS